MIKKYFALFVFILLMFSQNSNGISINPINFVIEKSPQDQSRELQILYNGRVWRDMFTNVKGDQFLFSRNFLPGSLSMGGYKFDNVNINYDLYDDELLIPKNNGIIIQVNKEMVDSFSLVFQLKKYYFRNTDRDSLSEVKGFVNVLYSGKSSLYIKFKKEIQPLAVDDKFDLFFQTQKLFLVKNGVVVQLKGKRDLFNAMKDYKSQVRAFMKKNGYKISRKIPETYIPAVRYYDSLRQ